MLSVEIPENETDDMRLLIGLVLLILGWNRKKLGAEAGVGREALSRYENGAQKPQPRTLKKIEAATRVPLAAVKALLPALHRLRAVAEGRSAPTRRSAAAIARAVGNAVESILREEEPYLPAPELPEVERSGSRPTAADRLLADDLWARLKGRTHSARLALVEEAPQYQSWALAERLCAESERAAADSPRQAVELAELALRAAERVSGEAAWLSLLAGYIWAYLGNARRVASDLPAAEQAFRLAWKLWNEGSAADTGLLDGSRLLDLEASLLRAQRHMAAALERLDQALALHPAGEGRGRILLKKGVTLEQLGDHEAAVAVFHEAAPWIDREREPRNFCVLRFNLIVCLCHAGRYEEAAAGLSELRALTAEPRQGMDRVRRHWLEGRIAGGLGRISEGIAALAAVRAEFAAEKIFYDEALVSLELAGLYLEQGRTAEVKALAGQMEPVFRAQGVHEEAKKALRLFRRAVELETVTVELVRRLVAYLYRAQNNPELRFEAEG
jgi:tetratricopeptide (TPR) repeat protein/DNA-binding XRE family transcriptional regulator